MSVSSQILPDAATQEPHQRNAARPPLARPKYLLLAEELKKMLAAGRWNRQLPTVRAIAKDFTVSVVTAARALQVLVDCRLVRNVERSGCFRRDANTDRRRLALVIRGTPSPWGGQERRMLQSAFAAGAENFGVELVTAPITVEAARPGTAADFIDEARAEGAQGVVFMPFSGEAEDLSVNEAILKSCQKHAMPVVLFQRYVRLAQNSGGASGVYVDDLAGSRVLTHHLLEQGRQRIAFVMADGIDSHEGRLAGYLHELTLCERPPFPQPLVLRVRANQPFKASSGELAERLMSLKADGAVCCEDWQAMGLVLECFRRGLHVPDKLAVAAFGNLAATTAFPFGISSYELPLEEAVRHCVRLLDDQISHPRTAGSRVVIPGKLAVRESSAPM